MRQHLLLVVRPAALLVLVAAAMGSAGCVPGVGWLPDSSGIVYTADKDFNQLVLYDFKKGEKQVLVADMGAQTLWPAVSPDGQRIAVAKWVLTQGQKLTHLQVIVFDRKGKEVHRSKLLDWLTLDAPANAEAIALGDKNSEWPQLFWAPKGDSVAIHTNGYSAIYDTKEQKVLREGEGALLVFRGGPVRPDGAGFLVMKNPKGWTSSFASEKPAADIDPHFAFVAWDGTEKAIKAPKLMLDVAAMKKETNVNKLMALFVPVMFNSGWDGDVAQVTYHADRLRYFTGKGEAILDNVKPEMTDDGFVLSEYQFAGGKGRFRTVAVLEKGKGPDQTKAIRLEAFKAGKKEPEVLTPNAEFCVPVLSPDGKMAAIRCYSPPRGKDRAKDIIMVLNGQAEVVANLIVQ